MTVKLCKDCKWISFAWNGDPGKCLSPRQALTLDLVTGELKPRFTSAHAQRCGDEDCGKAGTWFEPPETL